MGQLHEALTHAYGDIVQHPCAGFEHLHYTFIGQNQVGFALFEPISRRIGAKGGCIDFGEGLGWWLRGAYELPPIQDMQPYLDRVDRFWTDEPEEEDDYQLDEYDDDDDDNGDGDTVYVGPDKVWAAVARLEAERKKGEQ